MGTAVVQGKDSTPVFDDQNGAIAPPRTTSRPLLLSSWIVPARRNSALTITPPLSVDGNAAWPFCPSHAKYNSSGITCLVVGIRVSSDIRQTIDH